MGIGGDPLVVMMVVILVLPLSALWGRDDEFSMWKPCLAFGTADDSWVMMTKMASCVKLYNTCTKVCFVNVLLMFSPTVLSSIKHRELKSSGWQSYSVSISDFSELELKPKLWSSGASGAPVCTALSANSPPIFNNYFSFNEKILLFSTKKSIPLVKILRESLIIFQVEQGRWILLRKFSDKLCKAFPLIVHVMNWIPKIAASHI